MGIGWTLDGGTSVVTSSDTEPENKDTIWSDTTEDPPVLKAYNPSSETWEKVNEDAPVQSVNGDTGEVSVEEYSDDKAADAAPIQSVNGEVGDVSVDAPESTQGVDTDDLHGGYTELVDYSDTEEADDEVSISRTLTYSDSDIADKLDFNESIDGLTLEASTSAHVSDGGYVTITIDGDEKVHEESGGTVSTVTYDYNFEPISPGDNLPGIVVELYQSSDANVPGQLTSATVYLTIDGHAMPTANHGHQL